MANKMFLSRLPFNFLFFLSLTCLKAQEVVPPPELESTDQIFNQFQIPESLNIVNDGGSIEGVANGGIRFGGPVKITGDQGLEIFADRAELTLKNQSVLLEGNVIIYQGDTLQRGETVVYNYETGKIDSNDLRVSMNVMLLESGKFTGQTNNGKTILQGENAGISTHDVQSPGFWLRADQTKVYAGEKITFKNLKVIAGNQPVFWLPYLSQPLDAELGYRFVPGTRSGWGPYLLNTYGVLLGEDDRRSDENARLLSRWKMDLISRRGIGLGLDLVDFKYKEQSKNSGFSLYYLNDLDPTISRTGAPRFALDEHRYHAKLYTSYDINEHSLWRIETHLNYLSDRHYLEDYLPESYQTNYAPDNIIGIYRKSETALFSTFVRLRVNNFYRTDTQSPEISYDQITKPLWNFPILHQGQTSFSVRNEQIDDVTNERFLLPIFSLPPGDPEISALLSQMNSYERSLVQRIQSLPPGDPKIALLKAQLEDVGFTRFHTNHDFSYPISYQDWLSLKPYIGATFTNYNSVTGPAESDHRLMLHRGAEVSLKFSKDFGNRYNQWPGVNGLMHVLKPYTIWSNLSVDELSDDYPKVDRLTFTTRPSPLHVSNYTAIDDFEDWNILRYGLRNHLLTRRDGGGFDWLSMDTYIDHFLNTPESDISLSNLYNDLTWRPLPWLNFGMEFQVPVIDGGSEFTEVNTYSSFMPSENMEILVSYRNLKSHPALSDSQSVNLRTYLRLTEDWGIGSNHFVELQDNTLELQQYTLHRDLGNWVFGVGITGRDNRFRKEFGVVLNLSLKDFPSSSLPFGIFDR